MPPVRKLRFYQPKRPPQSSTQSSQPVVGVPISIKLRNSAGQDVHFKILTTTVFQKVFDAYCNRVGKDSLTLRFFFGGQRVSPEDTPAIYKMEDEDIIDVYDEQKAC